SRRTPRPPRPCPSPRARAPSPWARHCSSSKRAAGACRLAAMKRIALATLVALAVPAVALSAPPKPGNAGSEAKHDPDDVTAISAYMEALVAGKRKFLEKDASGAVDQIEKAIALAPKRPLG